MCNKWLSVDRDDGAIERLLPAATEKDVANFEYIFFTSTQKVTLLKRCKKTMAYFLRNFVYSFISFSNCTKSVHTCQYLDSN